MSKRKVIAVSQERERWVGGCRTHGCKLSTGQSSGCWPAWVKTPLPVQSSHCGRTAAVLCHTKQCDLGKLSMTALMLWLGLQP